MRKMFLVDMLNRNLRKYEKKHVKVSILFVDKNSENCQKRSQVLSPGKIF